MTTAPAKSVYLDCTPYLEALITAELRAIIPNLVLHVGDPSSVELPELLANASAIVNGHTNMDAKLLEACSSLRTIVFLGTGASSYIDVTAADRLGIRVRTIRKYGDRSIAEHTFGLIIASARRVTTMDRDLRRGRWAVIEGMELAGKILGIVGVGGVGREVIRIGAGFGMEILAWNRSEIPHDLPCRSVELEHLLQVSDVISLHLALTNDTNRLIDARRLAMMRKTAILVNTARGAIVDEAALLAALQAGQLAHAALDVFETEPLVTNHPFTRLDNVTLTTHAAYKTVEASRRLLLLGFEALRQDLSELAAGHALSHS